MAALGGKSYGESVKSCMHDKLGAAYDFAVDDTRMFRLLNVLFV